MIGRLGTDAFGMQLRAGLDTAGVDTGCVTNVDGPSGSAVILVTPHGGNSIVVVPGANNSLQPEDLETHLETIRGASILLAQLEIPLNTVERLGELAAELGIPFLLDPAPAQALSGAMLRNVTWLTPNESETRTVLEHLGGTVDDSDVAGAAERILATGVRNVILKLGSRGMYLAGKDVEAGFVPAYRVTAVDTTAAGDAFNGGFAYALTRGQTPLAAAGFAAAVAGISVTRVGAQPSMPQLADVEALMASAPATTT